MLIATTARAGFVLAGAAFALLAVLMAVNYRGTHGLRWLLAACAGSAIWAIVLFGSAGRPEALAVWMWPADLLHGALWLAFLASLCRSAAAIRRMLVLGAIVAAVWGGAMLFLPVEAWPADRAAMAMLLTMSLLGLSAVEQIYRNSDLQGRRLLRPLCVAVGGLFVFDLFVYSHGVLLTALDPVLWGSRGFVSALIAAPLLLGVKRHRALLPFLFVSRDTLFHSATLAGSGAYLIAMALVGYVIRVRSGQWGVLLEILFLAASVSVFAFTLSSAQLRARMKVFIAKHFYRYRYDYREEWHRLIATLSDNTSGDAPSRALKALANILHSRTGELWISRAPGERYELMAKLTDVEPRDYPNDHPLIRFLSDTAWIVDTREYLRNPEHYSHALRELPLADIPPASVFVPICHEDRLLGLARLDRPPGVSSLDFEDHDLLKTVGRQMAVFVEQDLTRERLAETRQFEAFNRTTAFLMHDLKNLIAQQALIVQNAPRFKHKPEFVDDVIVTVERSVSRMRKVLEQLEHRRAEPSTARVSITAVLEEVVAQASRQTPVPSLAIDAHCEVRGDRDRLSMIVAHAVRNAQEATPAGGRVAVRASFADGEVTIEVVDTGHGMDETFIRERLFRPFDTTKPGSGMGIGAYQIREYVRSLGGRVEVTSRLAKGTRLSLVMPAEPLVAVRAKVSTRAGR